MNECDDDTVLMNSVYFYLCIFFALVGNSNYAAATRIGRRTKQNISIGFIYFLMFLPSDISFNNLS